MVFGASNSSDSFPSVWRRNEARYTRDKVAGFIAGVGMALIVGAVLANSLHANIAVVGVLGGLGGAVELVALSVFITGHSKRHSLPVISSRSRDNDLIFSIREPVSPPAVDVQSPDTDSRRLNTASSSSDEDFWLSQYPSLYPPSPYFGSLPHWTNGNLPTALPPKLSTEEPKEIELWDNDKKCYIPISRELIKKPVYLVEKPSRYKEIHNGEEPSMIDQVLLNDLRKENIVVVSTGYWYTRSELKAMTRRVWRDSSPSCSVTRIPLTETDLRIICGRENPPQLLKPQHTKMTDTEIKGATGQIAETPAQIEIQATIQDLMEMLELFLEGNKEKIDAAFGKLKKTYSKHDHFFHDITIQVINGGRRSSLSSYLDDLSICTNSKLTLARGAISICSSLLTTEMILEEQSFNLYFDLDSIPGSVMREALKYNINLYL